MPFETVFTVSTSRKKAYEFYTKAYEMQARTGFEPRPLRYRPVGLLAPLVKRCPGIAEVMGSNPIRD